MKFMVAVVTVWDVSLIQSKVFWQDFRKWKSVVISDYAEIVISQKKNLGKENPVNYGCDST